MTPTVTPEPRWLTEARESRRHYLANQRHRARGCIRLARAARIEGRRPELVTQWLAMAAAYRRGGTPTPEES